MIRIRPGTPADAADLAGFAARTFEESYGALNRPEDVAAFLAESYSPDIQAAELADPDIVTLIAADGATWAGYAQVRRNAPPPFVTDPAPVELQRFYIDPPWQGTGLARTLMDAVHEAAARLGGRSIWLTVWERNPRAIAFYARSGFRDAGAGHFRVGSDLQNDRIMVTSVRSL
jgi:ribosomal protein S18 acetylase RimI-like enzyme